MRAPTAAPRAVDPPAVAAQYETLRSAALGEPLPPEARHGLLLFRRRGMWAWTQAVATTASAPPPPARFPCAAASSLQPLRAVIQLFAAMALSSNHRSTQ